MSGSSPTVLLQEALALHRSGAVAEAAARYAEVLRLEPERADAHYYLGLISCQDGRFAEGAERARKALASDPRHAPAHVLLGRALAALGQTEAALASFAAAAALAPDLAAAHANRADLLGELGRHAEAVESYDRALALAPDSFADWVNRGMTLVALGRYEEAVASFDRARALDPDAERSALLCAPRLLAKLRICDWRDLDEESAQLLRLVRADTPLSIPSACLAVPSSPAEQFQCATRYVREQPRFAPLWRGELYAHDRLRIAYLSADFRAHATATLAAGLFEQHDRTRFEVTAISFGRNDGSPMRARLERAFDHFCDVEGWPDQEIADLLRRREIDIAVDLMGFTADHRLAVLARRPAPIQVNYLGYPATIGAPYIDYVLADATVVPAEHSAYFSEQVVWLPGCYQVNDDRRAVAPRRPSRAECGLPEKGFVFCCFNDAQKITPAFFDIWMRLLQAVDGSVLWLLQSHAAASDNLRREAEKRGVAAQRLIFAPRTDLESHLARHDCADLFLDTLPVNAHTTASDALWAGLPLVTCLGPSFVGRVAASLLKAVGLDELVTGSREAYEALALKLAQEPAALAAVRRRLAAGRRTCGLFDTGRTTRHIEAAYTMLWRRHQWGERPRAGTAPLVVAAAAE